MSNSGSGNIFAFKKIVDFLTVLLEENFHASNYFPEDTFDITRIKVIICGHLNQSK